MSGSQRSKGARAEREVAEIINAKLGTDMRRTPLSGGMKWKGDIQGWDGFHVEVKRQERLCIPEWLRQTEADCPEGLVPLLVYRKSRDPWRVVLPLDSFLGLVSR